MIQVLVALANSLFGLQLHWLYQAFIAQLFIVPGIVIVSLLTEPAPRERWEPFIWSRQLLARYDEGVPRPWYQKPALWLGVYAAVWVVPYVLYW